MGRPAKSGSADSYLAGAKDLRRANRRLGRQGGPFDATERGALAAQPSLKSRASAAMRGSSSEGAKDG
jgi:hypothetical protein